MTRLINAVLFDLDNTLIDAEGAFAAWAYWFVRDRLGLLDDADIEEEVTLIVRRDSDGYAPRETRLKELRSRHSSITEPFESFVTEYREQLLALMPHLDDTTSSFLVALEDAAIRWGIVTNGSQNQLDKISKVGLDTCTDCVLVSEIVGSRKPEPEIFLKAAEQIGFSPKEILFVGDHPTADIRGAAAVGMQTAWMRRGREWPQALVNTPPNHIIESLADLRWIVETQY